MEKYFKKKTMCELSPSIPNKKSNNQEHQNLKNNMDKVDLANLPLDPALRKPIVNYNPNIQEEVRRRYLQTGPLSKDHAGSTDAFVVEGFTNWKKKEKLQIHIGGPKSAHNQAANKQGFAFRGHDESDDSNRPGSFKATLHLICDHNEDIKRVAIDQCPRNLKLTSPDIQKDIVNACAIETTNSILHELGNKLFSILVDESRDIACKEQMALVIRYVNKEGKVVERLLDIVHVQDTSALSLKASIEAIFPSTI
ncbi:uncharacterized protein LOC126656867 [Mercurialis annua]|uniref:uncharacterized protein LOC126656867 n=1 Tax=Mercurialis annua TaxID=3986 RepID=UPI00215FCA76|nr:uncharacterized protein LOC126656867 [Mercurialis annua]